MGGLVRVRTYSPPSSALYATWVVPSTVAPADTSMFVHASPRWRAAARTSTTDSGRLIVIIG